jgi:hypothetical protein
VFLLSHDKAVLYNLGYFAKMNYTEVINSIKNASLFDLYRLGVAIRHEMENSYRIQQLRQSFKEGDTVSYFDEVSNSLQPAIIIQKNQKYVSVKNISDHKHWRIPYYLLNLANVNIDIRPNQQESLSKNNLKTGDCVGFNKDGEQIAGIVIRLNYKTVTLMTKDHRQWRVSYRLLFKVIDADIVSTFDLKQIGGWVKKQESELEDD